MVTVTSVADEFPGLGVGEQILVVDSGQRTPVGRVEHQKTLHRRSVAAVRDGVGTHRRRP